MADGEKTATVYTIGWEPQPAQKALLACPVFEVFFGGARGGGKTDGMLGEWASHADLHGKNAVGLMVRRERVQLLETIERSRQIYGPVGARYNDQDKMWRWPNGARLRFAYLERDADADVYQGHSYTRVYVEELGTFPSASPGDTLGAWSGQANADVGYLSLFAMPLISDSDCDGEHNFPLLRIYVESISRRSRGGDRRRICSPATRPGASPPPSPSCRTAEAVLNCGAFIGRSSAPG